jgi:hypothetical protein
MKTGWRVLALALVLLLVVVAVAFAAQRRGGGRRGGGMGPEMGGRMGRGGGGMMMGAMHGTMLTSAIAVSGDNVYVLVGNQLMKYDADLKLVKEAEVNIDVTKMRKMMEEMRKQMPVQQMPEAPAP